MDREIFPDTRCYACRQELQPGEERPCPRSKRLNCLILGCHHCGGTSYYRHEDGWSLHCAGCDSYAGMTRAYVESLEKRPYIARGIRSTPKSRAQAVAKYGVRDS